MDSAMVSDALYLGIDLSTQQLKFVVINEKCHHVAHCSVNFCQELPHYGTENGYHRHPDGVTITTPVLMWLEAIDLCFMKLSALIDMSKILSISGCAQQHGTVYWNSNCHERLSGLSKAASIVDALKDAFSITNSPIWMDSSTSKECSELENATGGPMKLAAITGSRAFHRFSGNQIKKVFDKIKQEYLATKHISLVSSFIASVLCGRLAEIEIGDAGGMNMMDMRSGTWSEQCLNAIANGCNVMKEELKQKLGQIIPGNIVLSAVSPYFTKYGLSQNCSVIAFTGDNLASLAGLCLQNGDLAISLGTSDTIFIATNEYKPNMEGNIFRNPTRCDEYISMICFKNGSVTRDRIRFAIGASNWSEFSTILAKTQPGNSGNIGFYFDFSEISPDVEKGDYRFNFKKETTRTFSPEFEARAIIEHQCMSKKLHAMRIGYEANGKGQIVVTGGASCNQDILQVLADVFDATVFTSSVSDSAALGGAFRARHVCSYPQDDYLLVTSAGFMRKLSAEPNPAAVEVYNNLIRDYEELESRIIG